MMVSGRWFITERMKTGHWGGEADPAADRGVHGSTLWVVVAICSACRRAPHAASIFKKARELIESPRRSNGHVYKNHRVFVQKCILKVAMSDSGTSRGR